MISMKLEIVRVHLFKENMKNKFIKNIENK